MIVNREWETTSQGRLEKPILELRDRKKLEESRKKISLGNNGD